MAGEDRVGPQATGGEGPTRDAMAGKVRSAAEAYGRKFYIMYDVSGWTTMQSEIKADWTNKMQAHTASSAYARQNGKPVVCIWGLGYTGHPGTPQTTLDIITYFKSQGLYVIGGVDGSGAVQTSNLWTVPDTGTGDLPAWHQLDQTNLPAGRSNAGMAAIGSFSCSTRYRFSGSGMVVAEAVVRRTVFCLRSSRYNARMTRTISRKMKS